MTAVTIQDNKHTQQMAIMPQNFEQMGRLAELMAGAKLVPSHLQNKPSDCMLVIQQALQWGMNPFAVAQSTSVVHSKIMYEGKLIAAVLNASGMLSTRLNFKHEGTGATRTCTAFATLKGESEPRTATVKISVVQTNNERWKKDPDTMLVYSASRAFARTHVPEVITGIYSPEEFMQQPINITPQQETVQNIVDAVEQRMDVEYTSLDYDWETWCSMLIGMIEDAESIEALEALRSENTITQLKYLKTVNNSAFQSVINTMDAAKEKFNQPQTQET